VHRYNDEPELFARALARDLGLSGEIESLVAFTIREHLCAHMICVHGLTHAVRLSLPPPLLPLSLSRSRFSSLSFAALSVCLQLCSPHTNITSTTANTANNDYYYYYYHYNCYCYLYCFSTTTTTTYYYYYYYCYYYYYYYYYYCCRR
jgi:hypothetical protein